MEKEKGNGLIIVVVILVMMILGLGGYLVYDKVLEKKPEESKPAETINAPKTYESVGDLIKKVAAKYSSTVKKEIGVLITDKEYLYAKLYDYNPAGRPKVTLVITNKEGTELFREVITESGQGLELGSTDASAKLYSGENYYITTEAVYYLSNGFSCTNNTAKEYKIVPNNDTVTKTEAGTHTVTVAGACS